MKRRIKKRMYAVSQIGLGLVAGTASYSRREAIRHFFNGDWTPQEWEAHKHMGFRTVEARVEVVSR